MSLVKNWMLTGFLIFCFWTAACLLATSFFALQVKSSSRRDAESIHAMLEIFEEGKQLREADLNIFHQLLKEHQEAFRNHMSHCKDVEKLTSLQLMSSNRLLQAINNKIRKQKCFK